MAKSDKTEKKTGKGKAGKSAALPFDGAVSRFVAKKAPSEIRDLLGKAGKDEILDPAYPYRERLSDDDYEKANKSCQLELVKVQRWLRGTVRA